MMLMMTTLEAVLATSLPKDNCFQGNKDIISYSGFVVPENDFTDLRIQ